MGGDLSGSEGSAAGAGAKKRKPAKKAREPRAKTGPAQFKSKNKLIGELDPSLYCQAEEDEQLNEQPDYSGMALEIDDKRRNKKELGSFLKKVTGKELCVGGPAASAAPEKTFVRNIWHAVS